MKRKFFRRKGPLSSLSTELTSAMREMGDNARFIHPEIWARWFQIAGEQLYQRTFPRMFRDHTLTIGVTNSSWMQELSFLRPQLLDRLSEMIGPGVVTDIRFVLDTSVGKNRVVPQKEKLNPLPAADPQRISSELREAANRIDDPDLAMTIRRAASRYITEQKK